MASRALTKRRDSSWLRRIISRPCTTSSAAARTFWTTNAPTEHPSKTAARSNSALSSGVTLATTRLDLRLWKSCASKVCATMCHKRPRMTTNNYKRLHFTYSPKRAREGGDEFFADEVVGVVDFLFRERFVGGAIGEGVGERFLVGGDFLALGSRKRSKRRTLSRFGAFAARMVSSTWACGTDLGSTTARSAADGRKRGHGLVTLGLRGVGEPAIERDFSVVDRHLIP